MKHRVREKRGMEEGASLRGTDHFPNVGVSDSLPFRAEVALFFSRYRDGVTA